jgi:metallophosphoesterase superfamily enzyme
MTARLVSLLKTYTPKEIVLLGDIKHNIPSSTIQERMEIKTFIDTIQSYGIIHIVPGNHDGTITKLLPASVLAHPSDGFIYDGIGFVHGHRWPTKELMHCRQIIISHTHPTIMLTDRLGYKTFESCWLRGTFIPEKLQEKYPDSDNPTVIVMPAFNPLCGGIAANMEALVGPLGKILDVQNAQVYLLDGSSLGRVKDIR